MENQVKKVNRLILGLIVFIGIFFRFNALIQNPSFWFDESALAYNIISLKYIDLFGVLHLQQVAPPMFLVLTKWIVSVFGTSELFFRLIPFVVGCLVFIPFYYLLRSIFDKNSTIYFAMFLLAINPKLIYYGIEFKPYILDVFFAVLILLIFEKIKLREYERKYLFLIGLGLGAIVWCSFPSLILVFVGIVTLLISQKDIKRWLILTSPVIFNWIIFVVYYLNISQMYKRFMTNFFYAEFNHITIPVSYFFNNEIQIANLVVYIAICVGILYMMINKKRFETAFIMWSFIVTIVLSQFHLYPAYERFILFLIPYTIIIIATVFNYLTETKTFQSRLVLVIIMLALIPTSITQKGSDSRELTKYFIENLNKEDFIVIDNLALPDFLFYTNDVKMDNKIVVPFEKINNRILYKTGSNFEFPEITDKFWFYSTRTKNFDKIIEKDGNLEKIKGYKIINKMITPNGGVFKVVKE
ncbi:glycosyltransferase family 39 protein [bacterium]|nr:glycosyltransferase family 39 protein [bacterium]